MTRWQKFKIWSARIGEDQSGVVDELLEAFMAEGTLTAVDKDLFEVRIQYHDKEYAVYLYADYGMSLRKCRVYNEDGRWDTVYEHLSPSRRVRLRFWEWLEDYGVTLRSPRDRAEDNIRTIIKEAHDEA